MKKILTVDGFVYNNEERDTECLNTVKWNSQYFDKIFIMCETQEAKDHYDSLNIKNVLANVTSIKRPTCKDQFDYCNSNASSDDLKFFANLDTVFTEKINDLVSYDLEDIFIIFTNRVMRDENDQYRKYDGDPLMKFNNEFILDENGFEKFNKSGGKWQFAACGWAWKTIKTMPELKAMLGHPGGEHVLLDQALEAGYKPRSAVFIAPTYHNHRSDCRTDRYNTRISSGTRILVSPLEA